MSAYKTQNIEFLRKLVQSNLRQRKKLIKTAKTSNLNAISEIALNLKNGNLPVHPKFRQKLKKFRNSVLKVANKKFSVNKKKQILLQNGGVLPLLASPFLATLAPIVGQAIFNSLNNV